MEEIVRILYATLLALSSLASVSGNLLLLLLLLLNKELRTDTLGLTLSFSLSDLALGMFITPLGAYNGLTCLSGSNSGGPVCQGSAFVFVLLQTASIFSFNWMTVNRFTEICFALSYDTIWTPGRRRAVLVLVWTLCFVMAAMPLLGFGTYVYSESRFLCCPSFTPDNRCFVAAWISVGVTIPIFSTCSLYGYMVYVARKQARRGTFMCNELHCFYVPANNFLRSSMVMITVLVCLLVCWLPYISVGLYETFSGVPSPAGVPALSTWLVLSNAALNPWITCMTQTRYRATACRLLGRIILCPRSKNLLEAHHQTSAFHLDPTANAITTTTTSSPTPNTPAQ
eukprot:XP_011618095.1 PREDICTED: adenosine receptor A3-like [Takifugu rubripes]